MSVCIYSEVSLFKREGKQGGGGGGEFRNTVGLG